MEHQQCPFTEKELQVIQMLLEGKTNSQIALELRVTTRTVEQHLTHIYGKLGVNSRAEAIVRLIHLFEK